VISVSAFAERACIRVIPVSREWYRYLIQVSLLWYRYHSDTASVSREWYRYQPLYQENDTCISPREWYLYQPLRKEPCIRVIPVSAFKAEFAERALYQSDTCISLYRLFPQIQPYHSDTCIRVIPVSAYKALYLPQKSSIYQLFPPGEKADTGMPLIQALSANSALSEWYLYQPLRLNLRKEPV